MDSIYYEATTIWVIFIDLVMALACLWLFKNGKASNQTIGIAAIAFLIFIFVIHWIFGAQNIFPADLSGGVFFAIILCGAGVVLSCLYFTSSSFFDQVSQVHLQLVQGLRVFVGGGFLMEGVLDVIPAWFSIMDGFFHISSGFLALLAAIVFLQKWKGNRQLLWLANIVGIVDILVIVTSICFVAWGDLGPFHNMNYVVFGVGPILLWIHFNSIKKLLKSHTAG